jgi:4a-hydroxytetrahydrobiopterin dehydratase
MVEPLTPEEFHGSPGVQEWRIEANTASATFRTDTFERGLRFVNLVGALAESANHHPDVDLRYLSVMIRLTTHEIHALSDRDARLASQISAAARELAISAEPSE